MKFCFEILFLHGSHRSYPGRKGACFRTPLKIAWNYFSPKLFYMFLFFMIWKLRKMWCAQQSEMSPILFWQTQRNRKFNGTYIHTSITRWLEDKKTILFGELDYSIPHALPIPKAYKLGQCRTQTTFLSPLWPSLKLKQLWSRFNMKVELGAQVWTGV